MKNYLTLIAILFMANACFTACDSSNENSEQPKLTNEEIDRAKLKMLDEKFSTQWTEDERKQAASAASVDYLSTTEKEVFYYLNLMRLNPPRFAQTYALEYNGDTGWRKDYGFDERKQSLLKDLSTLESLPLLQPSFPLYEFAECFATNAGAQGPDLKDPHNRKGTGCPENLELNEWEECLDFGGCYSGYAIVMHCLIDAGINNGGLEHRKTLFEPKYASMGVAIRPNKKYQRMAVIDFSN